MTPAISRPADSERSSEYEKLYTVQEVAQILNVSVKTVRRTFYDMPGVIQLNGGRRSRATRTHLFLRIPKSILDRYLRGLTVGTVLRTR